MAFRSLVPIFSRGFSRSRLNVILVKDYPLVGFEGQIVNVKPGYAERFLIPNNIAVYNFPGTHERLFPDWDETQVTKKREQIELRNFVAKLDTMSIEIKKPASTTNPTFLRETLRVKDIVDQARSSLNLDLTGQNVKIVEAIDRFGNFVVNIEDYRSDRFDRKFTFRLRVSVKKEAPKQQRLEQSKTETAKTSA